MDLGDYNLTTPSNYSSIWSGVLQSLYYKNISESSASFLVLLHLKEDLHVSFGAPASIWISINLFSQNKTLQMELQWYFAFPHSLQQTPTHTIAYLRAHCICERKRERERELACRLVHLSVRLFVQQVKVFTSKTGSTKLQPVFLRLCGSLFHLPLGKVLNGEYIKLAVGYSFSSFIYRFRNPICLSPCCYTCFAHQLVLPAHFGLQIFILSLDSCWAFVFPYSCRALSGCIDRSILVM